MLGVGNFPPWLCQLRADCNKSNVWRYITPGVAQPEFAAAVYLVWEKDNCRGLGLLQGSIDEGNLTLVEDCLLAGEAYTLLETRHVGKFLGARFKLLFKLLRQQLV